MNYESQIVEMLKTEEFPYDLGTHQRIARKMNLRPYDVGKIAQTHSLIIDRVMDERRAKRSEQISDNSNLLPTMAQMENGAHSIRLEITDRQHIKEMEDLQKALETLEKRNALYSRNAK